MSLDIEKKIIKEVEARLDAEIVDIKIPPQGMDSRVFFAKDSHGKEYAVKHGKNAMADKIALELIEERGVDVPVPKLFNAFKMKGESVVVLEKIKYPLLESVSREKMRKCIPSMVENLRKIHYIKSERAGSLSRTGRIMSWKEILLSKFDGKDRNLNWMKIASRRCLEKKLVLQSVEKIVEKIEKTGFNEKEYSLLHTDFNQRNIFINPKSDKITGIIDWSEALFGDPIYDFARIRMFIWHFNLGHETVKAYNELMSYDENEKQLEKIYLLSRIVEYLAYYSEKLNEFNIGRIKLHQNFLKNNL